jgi:hypothetical protein
MLLLRVSCNFAIFRQLLLQVQFCLLMLPTNGLLTRAFVCRARMHSNFPAWNFSAWRHFAKISDLRLRGLFAFKRYSFSSVHKLQCFPPAEYDGARFKIDHLIP